MQLRLLALVGIAFLVGASAPDPDPDDRFDVVVIDPGHGGADTGARGYGGIREKDLALGISRRVGAVLEAHGIRVVFTRNDDRFLTLAERARIANRARGDLYLSIHANSAADESARGPETYFISLDATDGEARRVAMIENRVFRQEGTVADSEDIVGKILGDLVLTDHLRGSSAIAAAIQRNLARLPGPERGVKQAPFVVLLGVNMPAVLVEIGFVTNPEEADLLRKPAHQRRIADALVRAIEAYREVRDGVVAEGGPP